MESAPLLRDVRQQQTEPISCMLFMAVKLIKHFLPVGEIEKPQQCDKFQEEAWSGNSHARKTTTSASALLANDTLMTT